MTRTSTPAATFSAAAWAQVAKSSEKASNRKVQGPCSSSAISAAQVSVPSSRGLRRCRLSSPEGDVRRTCTPMMSCPSRNATTRKGTTSPTKAFGVNPPGTEGAGSRSGMRVVRNEPGVSASPGARAGI